MNGLDLESTPFTPQVAFRPEAKHLLMRGECYPENPASFFAPIFGAVAQHLRSPSAERFDAVFRLTYVNSASARALRRLFTLLEAAASAGARVRITWEYEAEDEVMEELGRDLASGLPSIDFEERATPPCAA